VGSVKVATLEDELLELGAFVLLRVSRNTPAAASTTTPAATAPITFLGLRRGCEGFAVGAGPARTAGGAASSTEGDSGVSVRKLGKDVACGSSAGCTGGSGSADAGGAVNHGVGGSGSADGGGASNDGVGGSGSANGGADGGAAGGEAGGGGGAAKGGGVAGGGGDVGAGADADWNPGAELGGVTAGAPAGFAAGAGFGWARIKGAPQPLQLSSPGSTGVPHRGQTIRVANF
jgi:hypothetical protein